VKARSSFSSRLVYDGNTRIGRFALFALLWRPFGKQPHARDPGKASELQAVLSKLMDSLLMSTDIRHVVSATPIPHELRSTVSFSVDASVVQLAKEIRRCVVAGLVCWTIVAVTKAVVGWKRERLQGGSLRGHRQRRAHQKTSSGETSRSREIASSIKPTSTTIEH
jgi:hypothetical protein